MRGSLVGVLMPVLAGGCGSLVGDEPAEIGVQVLCGACEQGDLRLEIDDEAWAVGTGGSASVMASADQSVRVVDADACAELVTFNAAPGHRYLVQVEWDGHATAVDLERSNASLAWGPPLGAAPVTACD